MSDRSIPQLAREVVDAALEYVRTEAAIIQRNVSQAAARVGTAAGLFTVAMVIALIGLVFLVIALFFALDTILASSLAALLTGVATFIVAGILAWAGASRLRGGER